MKQLFVVTAVLTSILAVSCKKEEIKPNSGSTSKTIKVEYQIQIASSEGVTSYLFPNADGKLVMTTEAIKRSITVVNFEYPSGNYFYVEAANTNPASHLPVQVQIFIDGHMVAEHSTSNPSKKAIASGNF